MSTGQPEEIHIDVKRATSMRRPARVKPFFLVVPTLRPSADRREAQLTFGLSFLERFGHRYSRSPTSGRRTMLPSRILKSPTRPTSIRTLCGAIAPVPAGCPQLETGAAVSEPN